MLFIAEGPGIVNDGLCFMTGMLTSRAWSSTWDRSWFIHEVGRGQLRPRMKMAGAGGRDEERCMEWNGGVGYEGFGKGYVNLRLSPHCITFHFSLSITARAIKTVFFRVLCLAASKNHASVLELLVWRVPQYRLDPNCCGNKNFVTYNNDFLVGKEARGLAVQYMKPSSTPSLYTIVVWELPISICNLLEGALFTSHIPSRHV